MSAENPAPADKPRIVVLTNGSLFASVGLRPVFAALRGGCDFRVVVTTGLRQPSDNRLVSFMGLMRDWGVRYTAYKTMTRLGGPVYERLGRSPVTVGGVCNELGIPAIRLRDINSAQGIDVLTQTRPALLLSYACPYRIKAEALGIPSIGAINVHSSLLPEFAGVSTYVHVLAEGQKVTGVTIHEMVERFDAGVIVTQEPIAIAPAISVAGLFALQHALAGEMLVDVLPTLLQSGKIEGTPQDLSRRSYRREPNRRDIRQVRARGHALVRLREAREILAVASGRQAGFSWKPGS